MIVALVLLSAFLHAAWNALLKREPDKDRAAIAAVAVAALIATIVAALRWAIAGTVPFTSAPAAGWSLLAGAFELLYFAALARALELGQLGTIYTISRGGAVLLVYPLSIAVYGEHVTTPSAIGSAIVFVGLVLAGATGPRRATSSSGQTSGHDHARAALAWSIACAVAIAAYHLFYKAALADAGASPSAAFALALTLTTLVNLLRTGATGRRAVAQLVRARASRVVQMGAICAASFLILMEGLAGAGAGFVLTLRNTSVLFATLLAWAIGERPSRAQAIGALLVAAGAVVMAF